MKNYERWNHELMDILVSDCGLAVDRETGKPVRCDKFFRCDYCDFQHVGLQGCISEKETVKDLEEKRKAWLQSEFIPQNKFEDNELVWVSDDLEHWKLRYFAKISEIDNHTAIFCYANGLTKETAQEEYEPNQRYSTWQYIKKYRWQHRKEN